MLGAKTFQLCQTYCDPMGRQVPLSKGFSRQEYWSGLLCPPPWNLPNPGIEPTSLMSPALAERFLNTQFSSVAQSCPTLCNPMNCSTPGLPVHHQLLQFTQTHIHQVSDAIEPPHPLLALSPPAPNPSRYHGLFQ